ncbi:MAG: DNA replication and repair protein RecF [Chryseosolibacter sp.]
MQLQTLQLINFKNYAEARVSFSSKINVLVGKNGSGKTNLLDAIHYLALTKSAVSGADNFCIRHGEQHFFLKGLFKKSDNLVEITSAFQLGSKKIFKEGVNEYQKLSDHIGKYPVVLIAPDDTDLVKEGSEGRRKFFDSIISQLDRTYLESLILYTQALKQRNGLLKIFFETNSVDPVALDTYDEILVRSGMAVFEKRKQFVVEYGPVFKRFYNFIVADEEATVLYNSELNNTVFTEGLRKSRSRDLALQRTSFGIHRDDYHFTLGQGDLKRLGSQGQQKSFIIALKLAQFDVIKRNKGFTPLLLLDDIFDKLDDFRIQKLLELIKNDELGQLFITDARPDRTAALLRQINVSSSVFKVSGGVLEQYEQQEF